jgi:hypothetical protein
MFSAVPQSDIRHCMSKEYPLHFANPRDGLAPARERPQRMNSWERYRALLCLENLQAIESWRDILDEAQRRRLNHPNAIWTHWRRSISAEASRQRQHVVATVTAKAARRGSNIAIRWPGTMLKRAAAAIREARSNDTIVLAKAALSAAIRTEVDLLELLPDPTPAKPAPRSIREAATTPLEVHA